MEVLDVGCGPNPKGDVNLDSYNLDKSIVVLTIICAIAIRLYVTQGRIVK